MMHLSGKYQKYISSAIRFNIKVNCKNLLKVATCRYLCIPLSINITENKLMSYIIHKNKLQIDVSLRSNFIEMNLLNFCLIDKHESDIIHFLQENTAM